MEPTLATLTDVTAAWRSLSFLTLYLATVLGVLYVLAGLGGATVTGPQPRDVATCGTCGRSWDCGTCGRSWDYGAHPTPATLCPFCNGDDRAAAPHEVVQLDSPEGVAREIAWIAREARALVGQDDEARRTRFLTRKAALVAHVEDGPR